MEQTDYLAAIDLGSNSFHMVVARECHGELQFLDGLSEKVQLGSGLDKQGLLSDEAMERGLACLARFSQRLEGVAADNIRIVGTNTLREARNAKQFMLRAEALLNHDIDIVAGREEARLIYLGVAHTLADDAGRRLVIDIGGGSTEFIIGERFAPQETESLDMGCVRFQRHFFQDNTITAKGFARAVTAARQEVLTIDAFYKKVGWKECVGASGSIKAINQVCVENGWCETGITLDALYKARKKVLKVDHADGLDLKGLKADRKRIFPSGLAILIGIFEQLGIDHMTTSAGALREGLLYDMVGRSRHEDVRERSVTALMERHHVDLAQAKRVADTTDMLFQQCAKDWRVSFKAARNTLRWAALLHEVGLAISHSQFHKHGAYMVQHADLPGFTRKEQEHMALLIRGHRRKLPLSELAEFSDKEQPLLMRLCLLLRLAVCLHHSRSEAPLPAIEVSYKQNVLALTFPQGWLAQAPLTQADIEQEMAVFEQAGYSLVVNG